MIVELTNHYVEMSKTYDVVKVEETRSCGKTYFQFYFGNGKFSKEYSTPTYTYRILEH